MLFQKHWCLAVWEGYTGHKSITGNSFREKVLYLIFSKFLPWHLWSQLHLTERICLISIVNKVFKSLFFAVLCIFHCDHVLQEASSGFPRLIALSINTDHLTDDILLMYVFFVLRTRAMDTTDHIPPTSNETAELW